MSSTVIPGLRYEDARRAIEWLGSAFGFTVGLLVEGEAGSVAHAQLLHGSGMVMIGSTGDDEYGRHFATPRTGKPTAAIYVVVDDVASHAETARAAGADILMEPEEQEYGGSNYVCRDLEGNIWSFGSYNPWAD
jgi:uncharacterized glyoxalase superfamily protein PhnB